MGGAFGFVMVFGIVGLTVWIWALVDCLQVPDDSPPSDLPPLPRSW